ncbi:MAG: pyridoxal phosphate-dependent aminotransferase [Gemmatimonadota bacterium]
MSPFPRPDYRSLTRYHFDRTPVELDLSDNTNRWGPHPAALEVLRRAEGDALARYPTLYADELRQAAARRLGVAAGCIATGCGSDDILDSAYRAAGGGPGDFVSVAAPTFSMAEPLARMNGMAARTTPWREALEDPARLMAGDPALVYVCRPNNPTGHLAPPGWVEALLTLAGDSGPLVLLDEAYIEFGGESFAGRAAQHPRLLVSRTLSKAFGLAGLRVGYAVGREDTILEVEKSRGPYKVSHPAGAAAAAALDDEAGWVERTVAECVANRARLARALAKRGLEPVASSANFLLFPAPGGDARADALALRARGVAARSFPGVLKDRDGDAPAQDRGRALGTGDALRVTVAPWREMERFLEALDDYLETLGEVRP